MHNKIEILAPGGNFECAKTAIDYGADSVYIGGAKFSARKNAQNLTNDEISQIVKYAHLRGVKVYVVINIIVSDTELEEVFHFVEFCYNEGVDAIILQDMALCQIIRNYFPDFKIHASTQMTIHNLDGVLMAQKMGFSRVVISRELSFNDIKYIKENSDIELEVFVHGALCMSYSGQCLMSSFLGSRSGNRGNCAQPCRLNYTLLDKNKKEISQKNKYLLSLKDLCLIDYLSELSKIGVNCVKIEGRMKGVSYVKGVCSLYAKCKNEGKISNDDKILLEKLFSRQGFTDGYYKSSYARSMLSYDTNHDNIYDSVNKDVLNVLDTFNPVRVNYPVNAHFKAYSGEMPYFEVEYNGKTFSRYGNNLCQKAINNPLSKDRIKDQLSKLGDTLFSYEDLKIDITDDLFISIKDINELRRQVFTDIENDICSNKREIKEKKLFLSVAKNKNINKPSFLASVLTIEQAKTAYDIGFDKIYVPYNLYLEHKDYFDSEKDVFCVILPPIYHNCKKYDFSIIDTYGVVLSNISHLLYEFKDKEVILDYRFNVFNSLSLKYLSKYNVSRFTLSVELTLNQIKNISKDKDTEVIVYGKIPLMTFKNCVLRSALNRCSCQDFDQTFYLNDRKNMNFLIKTDPIECVNTLYNAVPVFMGDKLTQFKDTGVKYLRFSFTDETPKMMKTVFELYLKGESADFPFTRGHFYNEVL